MDILLTIHSLVRWVILIVAIVAVLIFGMVWSGRGANERRDRTLMSAFVGLLNLQALLGLIYLLWSGLSGAGFPRQRLEHAFTMVLAMALAHVMAARSRAAEPRLRARNYLLTILGVVLLIVAGVSVLPGGWTR